MAYITLSIWSQIRGPASPRSANTGPLQAARPRWRWGDIPGALVHRDSSVRRRRQCTETEQLRRVHTDHPQKWIPVSEECVICVISVSILVRRLCFQLFVSRIWGKTVARFSYNFVERCCMLHSNIIEFWSGSESRWILLHSAEIFP